MAGKSPNQMEVPNGGKIIELNDRFSIAGGFRKKGFRGIIHHLTDKQ